MPDGQQTSQKGRNWRHLGAGKNLRPDAQDGELFAEIVGNCVVHHLR